MSKLPPTSSLDSKNRVRLDKWLWAARFYKTRSLATEEVTKGRVQLNGLDCKASREVKVGDKLEIRREAQTVCVDVLGLSSTRGSAPVAQALYRETADSVQARLKSAELRRLAPEPAHSLSDGRPTKRDRRALQNQLGLNDKDDVATSRARNNNDHNWDDRWSASIDSRS